MQIWLDRWNTFWFATDTRQNLCLLRIFFGSVFLLKLIGLSNLQQPGRLRAWFPKHQFSDPSQYYLGAYRHAIAGLEWLPLPSFELFQFLEVVLVVCAVFFVVGLFTRGAGAIIATIYLYFFLLSVFSYRHHIMLFVIVLLVLGFSRCSDHYSLEAYFKGKSWHPPPRKVLPLRLLQVLLSIIYFFSAYQKFNGGWMTGEIVAVFHEQGSARGFWVDLLDGWFALPWLAPFSDLFWRSLGPFTLFVEGLLVFGLWVPRLRRVSIFLGITLHLGIDMMMSVATFSMQMWALYIVFIYPRPGATVVLYDPRCARCMRFRRWANLLDWFRRLTWLDLRDPEVRGQIPELDPGKLEEELHVITPEGSVLGGFAGLRRLLNSFPATFWLSCLLYVPPLRQIGALLYRWLVHRRHTPDGGAPTPAPEGQPAWRMTLERAQLG